MIDRYRLYYLYKMLSTILACRCFNFFLNTLQKNRESRIHDVCISELEGEDAISIEDFFIRMRTIYDMNLYVYLSRHIYIYIYDIDMYIRLNRLVL